MRALDTPLLLDLLRGSPAARRMIRSLGPGDFATTEINLWELTARAYEEGPRGLQARLAAVERLRRKLTVLAVDRASTEAFGRLRPKASRGRATLTDLVAATLLAHGVTEWVTTRSIWPSRAIGSLRVTHYADGEH
jgi:predicted nucleic acid-binding protein